MRNVPGTLHECRPWTMPAFFEHDIMPVASSNATVHVVRAVIALQYGDEAAASREAKAESFHGLFDVCLALLVAIRPC
jgi:hypothetical protein